MSGSICIHFERLALVPFAPLRGSPSQSFFKTSPPCTSSTISTGQTEFQGGDAYGTYVGATTDLSGSFTTDCADHTDLRNTLATTLPSPLGPNLRDCKKPRTHN